MKYRAQRYPTRFPITLQSGSVSKQCMVTSISSTGACIVGETTLKVGDMVLLDYSVGRTRAVVKWKNEDKAGVIFERELSPDSLSRIRYALRGQTHQTTHRVGFTELR